MSRGSRRNRASDASVSLFPFLAVLICTMGALIVLLVLIVQQAGNATDDQVPSNDHVAQSPQEIQQPPTLPVVDDDQLAKLRETDEDLSWNLEMLQEARDKTLKRLQEQHALLSMVEDQSRDLKSQLGRLRDEVELLKSALQDGLDQEENHDDRLATLHAEIEATKSQLQQTLRNARQKSRSYAILPYEGADGTQRRPIFIECAADQVTFQPEGVTIHVEDLSGPSGRDNPLATALRTVREHLLDAGLTKTSGEAYPLLIVRPGGELAYAACRSALDGWDHEFGYELIPADMDLTFPPIDPALRQLIGQTVAETVRLRARFAAAARPPGRELSISSQTGGFVPTSSEENGRWSGNPSTASTSTTSRRTSGDTFPTASATTAAIPRDSSFPKSASNQTDVVRQDDGAAAGDDDGDNDSARSRWSLSEGPTGGPAAAHLQPGTPKGSSPGGSSPGSFSLAQTRGTNWALPNDTQGAIGVVRPVPLTCTADQLILHPESRTGERQSTFQFEVTTASAVQPLIATLWNRMERWGIAGNGMYWRPVLECDVTADGQRRYEELTALLQGSGMEIRRR